MSLRWRMLLILLVLFAVSITTTEALSYRTLRNNYDRLERAEADKDVERCVAVLNREISSLATFCRTWSAWDDACAFVQQPTPAFIASNMIPQTFINNDLDVIWWLDPAGKTVWGKFYNNESGAEFQVPEFAAMLADSANHLQGFSSPGQGTSGILLTSAGPLLVVAQPIVTAENKGPIRGTIVQGRLVDKDVLKALGDQTRVHFELWPDDGKTASGLDAAQKRDLFAHIHSDVWTATTGELLSIYRWIPDLSARNGMILRADIPRTISQYGENSLRSLTWAILVQDFCTALLVWATANWMVVRPLVRMKNYVLRLGEKKSQNPIKATRSDEIGALAREFERMYHRLDQQQTLLRSAKDSAEKANAAKSEFLARMSHEIRTPLNGVVGVINLLANSELSPSQLHQIELANEASEGLESVINDILDFSKIEAGKVELEQIDFNIHHLAHDLIELHTPGASRKGLKLTCEIQLDVPQTVTGDPGRLRQILNNLIVNALKFTSEGSVSLNVAVMSKRDSTFELRFEVSDTGIGIPIDRVDRLFMGFSQVDTSTTRRFGGTGLGLAISKRLVELMNGQIGVQSALGQGATFWFTIVAESKAVERAATSSAPTVKGKLYSNALTLQSRYPLLSGLHVLVADDNTMNQFITRETLLRVGCSSECVANGLAAVQRRETGKFDLVLMDCQMPEMDGWEATRLIRRTEIEQQINPIPIIALTAEAIAGDREKCLSAGMNAYVTKPINARELYDAMAQFIQKSPGDSIA